MSIRLEHISKTFGQFKALNDVSLTVETGELMALLGPSGSGKTTLLRIIAGLETADNADASIHYFDEEVSSKQVGLRGVGFVFQHYALFRHMTVFENVAFGLRVRPRKTRPSKAEIRERVFELLRLIQLEGLAKRFPSQLSGGQRQRVALARALAVEPRVLLLDEPFGALDAKVRQELRAWLRRLHEELHVTSVFVTHDQEEALEVADRVVVMNRGEIEQVGSPDEVFHRPQTEFVMRFLGQVNQFHGRVDQGGVSFASLYLDAPQLPAGLGDAKASIYIRPHQFRVETHTNGHPTIEARIVHVRSAGPAVRLLLETPAREPFHVELPQDRFQDLQITQGSTVYVSPREFHIFPGEGI